MMVNLAGEVGVIAPGKLAGTVIWDKDPIADITVLRRPAERKPAGAARAVPAIAK